MTRKISKEELRDKIDGNELDLSLCNLVKVPVRELVSGIENIDLRTACPLCGKVVQLFEEIVVFGCG